MKTWDEEVGKRDSKVSSALEVLFSRFFLFFTWQYLASQSFVQMSVSSIHLDSGFFSSVISVESIAQLKQKQSLV